MHVISSISMDDFTTLEEPTENESNGAFRVRIYPHTTEDDNFCWVELQVNYNKDYPHQLPNLKISGSHKVNAQGLAEIEKEMWR